MQSALIPPLVRKTRGVKDPISTSSTLYWYFHFSSFSCSLKIAVVVFPRIHLELTCVTLTSKNVVTPRDQKPPALKSSLASGLVTGLLTLNRSLSRGCKCGSTSTLVQTLPILGFHCHAIKNKIANHSIQKVPNLGNKRR